jgi:light-regulated signal transduction histidine kinase (bacteriophytochrome)
MVSSYLGLLERTMGEQITPTQKQFINFAVDGSKRMDNLIQDLLRLARVDADPRIERVSLTEVVEVVRHNLQVLLKEKNAKIKSSGLPAITADRTQVMQLLQNIIGNGIKYNGE